MSFLLNIAEFHDHLFWRTSANDCFYKMLFWYDPSKAIWPLQKPILLKLLFQKIKKLWISKKYISTILVYYVYVMLYYKILWFDQDFRSENLCFLNLYTVYAVKILELSLEIISNPSKWGTKHLYNCKGFFFML